eukprot:scaffold4145_cov115-Isochrysis_galbana.AAC.37
MTSPWPGRLSEGCPEPRRELAAAGSAGAARRAHARRTPSHVEDEASMPMSVSHETSTVILSSPPPGRIPLYARTAAATLWSRRGRSAAAVPTDEISSSTPAGNAAAALESPDSMVAADAAVRSTCMSHSKMRVPSAHVLAVVYAPFGDSTSHCLDETPRSAARPSTATAKSSDIAQAAASQEGGSMCSDERRHKIPRGDSICD